MDAWRSHHGAVALGDYTRDEVEDYTGCNPLLLVSCIEGGKFNLSCDESSRMIRHAQRFTKRMKDKCTEWGWSRYQSYVKACFTERAVPDNIDPEHIDHQFFHERNRTGYCISGAVREAVIKVLASLGTYLFSIEDNMRAMGHLVSNPSVVGYFLENAILLRLNNVDKKAELIPIQNTIQKAHRNSEEQLFNNWSFWHDYLDDYECQCHLPLDYLGRGLQANVHGPKAP